MAINEAEWLKTTGGNVLPDILVEAYKAKAQARDGSHVPEGAIPTHVFRFSDEEKQAMMKRQNALRDALSRKD